MWMTLLRSVGGRYIGLYTSAEDYDGQKLALITEQISNVILLLKVRFGLPVHMGIFPLLVPFWVHVLEGEPSSSMPYPG